MNRLVVAPPTGVPTINVDAAERSRYRIRQRTGTVFAVKRVGFVLTVALLCALSRTAAAQDAPADPRVPADPGSVTVLELEDGTDGPATAVQLDPAQEVAEPFDGQATEGTIRRVRVTLLSIAGALTVALVVYFWHTMPSRRLRVATRRAERRRAEPLP